MIVWSGRNRVLASLLSGALLAGVVNLHPWWPLAWIAPVPLLVAAFHTTAREARWLSLLSAVIGLATNFGYYDAVLGGPVLAVLLILLQALLWQSIVPATRRIVVGSSHWATVFVYPILWAAADTLVSTFSPHGSFGSLAYTQSDALPVAQFAALAGTPGIVFIVALFASTLALWAYRGSAMAPKSYVLPAALTAAVLAFGAWRLAKPPEAGQRIRIGLAAIDDFIGPRMPPALVTKVWDRYAAAIGELAGEGAKLILLPEKIEVLDEEPAGKRRLEWISALARQHRIYLGGGVGIRKDRDLYNRFWLFAPSGEMISVYDKQRPVPGIEREFTAGVRNGIQKIEGTTYGIAICKDMHFASLARSYKRDGADVMLVPAWDFDRDDWMTARMTAMRGVESGFTVIRASRQGMLTVSDRTGRILAEKRSGGLPGVSLIASAPLTHASATPYARLGDLVGYCCFVLAVGIRFYWAKLLPADR